jgi:hypothetical protein
LQVKIARTKCENKRRDQRKQILTCGLSHGIAIHVVEALNTRVLLLGHKVSPKEQLGHLDVVSTKELLHQERGLHVPCTQALTLLHSKPKGGATKAPTPSCTP